MTALDDKSAEMFTNQGNELGVDSDRMNAVDAMVRLTLLFQPDPETQHDADTVTEINTNPYEVAVDSERTKVLIGMLSDRVPYVDGLSNPDIGDKAIYLVSGTEQLSDLGRIIEGTVLRKEWKLPASEMHAETAPLEDNSDFLIMVSREDGVTKLVGSLRIADCTDDKPSETRMFFKNRYPESELPPELGQFPEDSAVWDIVNVSVLEDFRNGIDSVWLYYAMHRLSVEQKVSRWISNITPDEIRNLKKFIGIPFEKIEDTPTTTYVSPIDGTHKDFDFYYADARNVASVVEQHIRKLDSKTGAAKLLATIAKIGLWGSMSDPATNLKKAV